MCNPTPLPQKALHASLKNLKSPPLKSTPTICLTRHHQCSRLQIQTHRAAFQKALDDTEAAVAFYYAHPLTPDTRPLQHHTKLES